MAGDPEPTPRRNGRMRVPMSFDEAIRAALETKPPETVARAKKARVASRTKKKSKSA
jgi:hypothetical protein